MHKKKMPSIFLLTQQPALSRSLLAAASPPQEKPSAAGSGGSGAAAPDNRTKPFAGEAERSGKRGYCAAFNEALPVQQRLPREGE